MRWMRDWAAHARAVVKGMLFIGFSVQIGLGIAWMADSFGQVQDFGESGSALYEGIYGLLGETPWVMYLLQLGAAFMAGHFLLGRFGLLFTDSSVRREDLAGRAFSLWRGFALLTVPFALQCHMALLPYSLMSSLYLTALGLLTEGLRTRKDKEARRRSLCLTLLSVFCLLLGGMLSGAFDRERMQQPGHSLEGAMASRFAWSYIWQDQDCWSPELRETVRDVLWETSFCPGNMNLLQTVLEERLGKETARGYYLEIARTGWERHAPMVVRQIGWDMLGYIAAPAVFPLQMKGHAYDSYSGRNYEIMRDHAPVLTRYYVDYGCGWFGCCLFLALLLSLSRGLREKITRNLLTAGGWALAAVLPALALTMRGAGMMDYKYTIAVNELWLVWALLRMDGKCRKGE